MALTNSNGRFKHTEAMGLNTMANATKCIKEPKVEKQGANEKAHDFSWAFLLMLARPAGIKPATFGFGDRF